MWKRCSYKGQKSSFHSLWDSALLREKAGWTYEDWRLYLDTWTSDERSATVKGGFREWLIDCAVMSEPAFEWWTPGASYDESYYTGEIVQLSHTLVIKAAYRLAEQLNEIFDYE